MIMFGFWLFCIGFVDIEIIQTNTTRIYFFTFYVRKKRTSQFNLISDELFVFKNMNFRIIYYSS